MRAARATRIAVLAAAAALLTGCGRRVVVSGIGPEEAQRCAIVLRVEGLDAIAEPDAAGDPGLQRVTVGGDDADAMAAMQALEAHGLPRRPAPGFDGEPSSLIPTASEERARYIKGLSGEIEALLESVDGVVSAEALVSLPERRPLATVPEGEASASIVVTHAGEASPVASDEVRDVVVRAVGAEITPDRVSVLLKPVVRRRPLAPPVRRERDRVTEAAFLAAAGVLAAAQAVTVYRLRALRRARTRKEGHDARA